MRGRERRGPGVVVLEPGRHTNRPIATTSDDRRSVSPRLASAKTAFVRATAEPSSDGPASPPGARSLARGPLDRHGQGAAASLCRRGRVGGNAAGACTPASFPDLPCDTSNTVQRNESKRARSDTRHPSGARQSAGRSPAARAAVGSLVLTARAASASSRLALLAVPGARTIIIGSTRSHGASSRPVLWSVGLRRNPAPRRKALVATTANQHVRRTPFVDDVVQLQGLIKASHDDHQI